MGQGYSEGSVKMMVANDEMARPMTVTMSIERERDKLVDRLAEINAVLEKLKARPDVQEVLDALSQLGHRIY